MNVVRRYVFPLIWMIILGVIAASLAKMAFFPSQEAAATDDGQPTASFEEYATVPVSRGDIASTMSLSATVQADPGKPVTATHAGQINKVWVENGERVGKGDRLLQVRVPKEPEPAPPLPAPAPAAPGAPAPAAPAAQAPAPAAAGPSDFTYHTLHAPGSGTVRGLTVVQGQALEVGGAVATLSPGTYAIVADLTPEQQLELLDRDIEASAKLPTSSAAVSCSSPSIEEDDPEKPEGAQNPAPPAVDPSTGMPAAEATSVASLRCPVPARTKIVPGLSVTVTVDLGSATGVLTVPTTAVEGSLADGAVYLIDDVGGEPQRHPVTLGRRGEGVVEVKTGVKENQQVLQFVPGVDNPDAGVVMGGPRW